VHNVNVSVVRGYVGVLTVRVTPIIKGVVHGTIFPFPNLGQLSKWCARLSVKQVPCGKLVGSNPTWLTFLYNPPKNPQIFSLWDERWLIAIIGLILFKGYLVVSAKKKY